MLVGFEELLHHLIVVFGKQFDERHPILLQLNGQLGVLLFELGTCKCFDLFAISALLSEHTFQANGIRNANELALLVPPGDLAECWPHIQP